MRKVITPIANPNALYNKFFLFLQKKYLDSTDAEKNVYLFALRYKLFPQPFSQNILTVLKDRNLFIGYSLFVQEKFGINKPYEKNAYEFLKAYGFSFEQVLSYSFDEILKSCQYSGTNLTKLKINELFSFFCLNIKQEAVQYGVASQNSVKMVDEFENELINENEIDVEKIAERIQKKTKKFFLLQKDKDKLKFLETIKHPIMYYNTLRVMSLNVIEFFNEQQHLKGRKNSTTLRDISNDKER